MFGELQVCEWEDLSLKEKSVAIVRFYINDECKGIGTLSEIADKLGRSVNSLHVGLSKTKKGLTKRVNYRVELVEWVEYPKSQYAMFWHHKKDNELELIATGSMEELSLKSGYNENYLRVLASPIANKNIKALNKGVRNWSKELIVKKVSE